MSVQHHGLGIPALNQADVQLRIIGQDRVDPHQNGIEEGSEPVREQHRRRTADLQGSTIPGGNAAVDALSITDQNKRSFRSATAVRQLPQNLPQAIDAANLPSMVQFTTSL